MYRKAGGKIIRRRAGTLLLSLIVAVSMMPVFAFAEDRPETDAQVQSLEQQTEVQAQTAAEVPAELTAEADDGSDQGTVIAGDEAAEADQGAVIADDEVAEDAGDIEAFELVMPSVDLPDSNELLTQYIEQKAGAELTGAPGSDSTATGDIVRKNAKLAARRSRLNASEQKMFDGIRTAVSRVANGESYSPVATIAMTASEFTSCDFNKIVNTLLIDLPYEMYWCDKTEGALRGYSSRTGTATVYFAVSADYRTSEVLHSLQYTDSDGVSRTFTVYKTDLAKTGAASSAVIAAKKIVAESSVLSDIDKLYQYKDAICALTSYDRYLDIGNRDYGDPWQLIYVFDGDPDTKVICEGYAKAFQLLCNLTSFGNDTIECYTITGAFQGNSQTEGHMWNVLHMDDGRNYIADITNCDSGTVGNPDKLFLSGCSGGSVSGGYVYLNNLRYLYDSDALSLYKTVELEMSDSDYSEVADKVTHYRAKAPTCTTSGNIEYWMKSGHYYSDNYCTSEITKAQTVAGALGHSWYTAHDTLDDVTYRCARCGAEFTASKVVVDLSKVSIKSPSKAKGAFTAKWKKVSTKNRKKIGGIEIQYSTDRNFTYSYVVKTAKKTATSKKFSKLARKKAYYVRVRSYKWVGNVKHVSAWSSVKRVKTK